MTTSEGAEPPHRQEGQVHAGTLLPRRGGDVEVHDKADDDVEGEAALLPVSCHPRMLYAAWGVVPHLGGGDLKKAIHNTDALESLFKVATI